MNHQKVLYSTEQIRCLEQEAIEKHNISVFELMQHAGKSAFTFLQQHWSKAQHIGILCGPGNNAGDGYIIGEQAIQSGFQVQLISVTDQNKLQGAAQQAMKAFCDTGGTVNCLTEKDHTPLQSMQSCDVLVDALLGTGLNKPPQGLIAHCINWLNQQTSTPVFAIDVPSGLNADSGQCFDPVVNAEATLTFIGYKRGMHTGKALNCCGHIHLNDLSLPTTIFQQKKTSIPVLSETQCRHALKKRQPAAHKKDYGHVLVVGGDYGMQGAIRMAGEAALRVGAGLVSVATRPEHAFETPAERPELMCFPIEHAEQLTPLIEKATVIIIGPGIGNSEWSNRLWHAIESTKQPKVIDAQGLDFLPNSPLLPLPENCIITPHPGEAGRLLNCAAADIENNRFQAITNLQQKIGGTVVLKGAGTLIMEASGQISLCDRGNPGMATGGMGDVLSGVIGGLLAQSLSPAEATKAGVFFHAHAADIASESGQSGLIASDLFLVLKQIIDAV